MNEIPAERKLLFYGGYVLIGLGLMLFLSAPLGCGSKDERRMPEPGDPNFWSQAQDRHQAFKDQSDSGMTRAFLGMGLIVAGNIMQSIGRKGLAGSGVVLDPEQERADMRPWSRMKGGMVNDALQEVDAVKAFTKQAEEPRTEIKIRCRSCKGLNPEDAKFCNHCGQPV